VADPKGSKSITGLARSLGELPADKKRAALELSAALAGVSLRVSREFVEAVPLAAEVLSADDLRHWGEFGRRLAMGSSASGVEFFASGIDEIASVPEAARATVFKICTRQLVLSSSTALTSYRTMPAISAAFGDDKLLGAVLDLALEIANRSAKHSAEFLEHTPAVAVSLAAFDSSVADQLLTLAADFANRTGGLTAELWQQTPSALQGLSSADAVLLLTHAGEFLDLGGSVTLRFIASGGDV
jgi:hypothetical protein